MQIVRAKMCFNANFVHAQPRSLPPYPSGTPRAASTLARALHAPSNLLLIMQDPLPPQPLFSLPLSQSDVRDTRKFYATLPLANTLGRLTRVGIGPLSLENEKQQANGLCPNCSQN